MIWSRGGHETRSVGTQMPVKQKFHRGDHVRVRIESQAKSHFPKGEGIVVGSYNDKYGKHENGHTRYTVFIKGAGEVSWYDDEDLVLVAKHRRYLLHKWKTERAKAEKLHGDLDWIFSHFADQMYGTGTPYETINALSWFPLPSQWTKRGEANVSYFSAAKAVALEAEPFLLIGDKDLWLEHVEHLEDELLETILKEDAE